MAITSGGTNNKTDRASEQVTLQKALMYLALFLGAAWLFTKYVRR